MGGGGGGGGGLSCPSTIFFFRHSVRTSWTLAQKDSKKVKIENFSHQMTKKKHFLDKKKLLLNFSRYSDHQLVMIFSA